MKKIIVGLFLFFPIGIFAATGATTVNTGTTTIPPVSAPVDADSMVYQMKTVLDQYATRIKSLEKENAVLRMAIMQAGIKIPLSAYAATGVIDTVVAPIAPTTPSQVIVTPSTPASTVSGSTLSNNLTDSIATTYGTKYAGFVQRIHIDWSAIQEAYKMSTGAYIGGYEFVTGSTDNHVFVDVIYPGHTVTASVYDAKILYEYNTGTYQRKLIGFFEYDLTTGLYTTRTGNNPYKGVPRLIIADPYNKVPGVISTTMSGSTAMAPVVSGTGSTNVTFTDIETAYTNKRYLSVIALSNSYLASNSPTYDLLRIRYRTYFIIGKFNESLAEIAKIETLGKLSVVACDAQVIATYSQNQALVDKYTKACSKK